jgi:hypothetical protein
MAQETIQLDDEGTWPREIHGLVAPNAAQIHQELELERRQSVAGKSWLSTIGEVKVQGDDRAAGTPPEAAHGEGLSLHQGTGYENGPPRRPVDTMAARVYAALEPSLGPAGALKAKAMLQDYAASAENMGSRHLLWFYLTEGQTTDDASRPLWAYFGGK